MRGSAGRGGGRCGVRGQRAGRGGRRWVRGQRAGRGVEPHGTGSAGWRATPSCSAAVCHGSRCAAAGTGTGAVSRMKRSTAATTAAASSGSTFGAMIEGLGRRFTRGRVAAASRVPWTRYPASRCDGLGRRAGTDAMEAGRGTAAAGRGTARMERQCPAAGPNGPLPEPPAAVSLDPHDGPAADERAHDARLPAARSRLGRQHPDDLGPPSAEHPGRAVRAVAQCARDLPRVRT